MGSALHVKMLDDMSARAIQSVLSLFSDPALIDILITCESKLGLLYSHASVDWRRFETLVASNLPFPFGSCFPNSIAISSHKKSFPSSFRFIIDCPSWDCTNADLTFQDLQSNTFPFAIQRQGHFVQPYSCGLPLGSYYRHSRCSLRCAPCARHWSKCSISEKLL